MVGFQGFLRKSSLLLKTCSTPPRLGIVRSDVTGLSTSSFILSIRHSKTIQFGQRVLALPFASCPTPALCPVRALLFHLFASPLPANSPLFAYKSEAGPMVLSQSGFAKRLKQLLSRSGYDASLYSAHSLRRGGTSFAINAGLDPIVVKARGDWSSNAWERYIFLTSNSTLAAAQQLSRQVSLNASDTTLNAR